MATLKIFSRVEINGNNSLGFTDINNWVQEGMGREKDSPALDNIEKRVKKYTSKRQHHNIIYVLYENLHLFGSLVSAYV